MASVSFDQPNLERHVDPSTHPVWMRSFNSKLRQEQLKDDLFAGRSVTTLLSCVVALGLAIGAVAVLLCAR